jgi:arginase
MKWRGMSRFAVIEAPSILGLRPTGVEMLPEALIRAGLIDRLVARHAGHVAPQSPYDFGRDSATLTLNATGIASYSRALANAVGEAMDGGEFPVVLGGDCSIMLGDLLALKRRGRYGLLFMDGHADFYNPEANPNGEAASMELAFATGRGPDVLSWDELTTAMRIAIESHRVVGLEITIYNPKLDPDGAGARGLVNVISEALALGNGPG